jgi:hypothetical protein
MVTAPWLVSTAYTFRVAGQYAMALGLINPPLGGLGCVCPIAAGFKTAIAPAKMQPAGAERLMARSRAVRKMDFMRYFTLITKYLTGVGQRKGQSYEGSVDCKAKPRFDSTRQEKSG